MNDLLPCKFCQSKVVYACRPDKPEVYTECTACHAWWLLIKASHPAPSAPVADEKRRAALAAILEWEGYAGEGDNIIQYIDTHLVTIKSALSTPASIAASQNTAQDRGEVSEVVTVEEFAQKMNKMVIENGYYNMAKAISVAFPNGVIVGRE